MELNRSSSQPSVLKKTVGNSERNKENRRQFRCDLRWLNKELEWTTVDRLPNRLLTRANVEKKSVIWTSEAWEINWNRFPITEGIVQLPRGSARAKKVAKQQIGVTFHSRARDEVIFSHPSRKLFFSPRSFQYSIFQFPQFWKKNFGGPLARATSLYIR